MVALLHDRPIYVSSTDASSTSTARTLRANDDRPGLYAEPSGLPVPYLAYSPQIDR